MAGRAEQATRAALEHRDKIGTLSRADRARLLTATLTPKTADLAAADVDDAELPGPPPFLED